MENSFAVMHSEKGSGTGGGLGNHIDRTPGMEHTYPHADPTRINKNISLPLFAERDTMTLPEAIKSRIEEGYTKKTKTGKPRAIRSDAVKYVSTVFTASHKAMINIYNDRKLFQEWVDKNTEFAIKEFGKKNVIRFTLHLDEKTPHIHCVHVPITKEGGLSAKEFFGNKKTLSQRQDRYAIAMKEFGLERGIRDTGIKHENASDYYKRIKTIESDLGNNKIVQIIDSKAFNELPLQEQCNKMKNFIRAQQLYKLDKKSTKEVKDNSKKRKPRDMGQSSRREKNRGKGI